MVDNEGTTKVEEEKKEGAPEGEAEELLSLESLDSIISSEDPEFADSLTQIGHDEPIEIYNEGLDLEYTLEAEIKLWSEATGVRKKLLKIFPFLPKISYKVRMKRTTFRLSSRKWKEQAIYRIKNAGPLLLRYLGEQAAKSKAKIGVGFDAFKAFSVVKKLSFVGLIAATGAAGYLFYRLGTHGLMPQDGDLFIGSLADWSQNKYQYDPKNEMESFYESTRTAQNVLVMKKMVVNLRRSSESGQNPMGAFEFYVEGTASEVVVEIKDREPEIEDLFLRTIEEMTFDQVSSGEGKRLLCDRLRKEVNKVLTKGYVRRVFIKTAIIKP
ncbi:MAG: flagellar basal body-associated FliL family protein [Bdellovibrio sp.]|nr:flagellar basal body-associated FliL family protein [Bdellovibrio sp.]